MKLVLNSLPKSGTHVLVRLMTLLKMNENELGLTETLLRANSFFRRHFKNPKHTTDPGMGYKVSLEYPNKLIHQSKLEAFLDTIDDGAFVRGHLPYSEKLAGKLISEKFKILYIVRDPRDVLYSLYYYVLRDTNSPLYSIEGFHNQLKFLIQGYYNHDKIVAQPPFYSEVVESTGWYFDKYVHHVKFEEIIGEKGGGSKELQRNTVAGIVKYLGFNDVNLDQLCKKVFYTGSKTFHKGQIGQWRELMTTEIKEIIKNQIGHIIIRLGYEKDYNW